MVLSAPYPLTPLHPPPPGLLSQADSPFAAAVAGLMKGSVDVLTEASAQLPPLLGYPLSDTAASEDFKPVSDDRLNYESCVQVKHMLQASVGL